MNNIPQDYRPAWQNFIADLQQQARKLYDLVAQYVVTTLSIVAAMPWLLAVGRAQRAARHGVATQAPLPTADAHGYLYQRLTRGVFLPSSEYLPATVALFLLVSTLLHQLTYVFPHKFLGPLSYLKAIRAELGQLQVVLLHWFPAPDKYFEMRELLPEMAQVMVTLEPLMPGGDYHKVTLLAVFLLLALVFSYPLALLYRVNFEGMRWLYRYYLALALLISIPAQLLTDLGTTTYSRLSYALFFAGWILVPAYGVVRFVSQPFFTRKTVGRLVFVAFYQAVAFFTSGFLVLYLGHQLIQAVEFCHTHY